MEVEESKPRPDPKPLDILTSVTVKECGESDNRDRKYKVLLVGMSGVGKTSLRNILQSQHFDHHRQREFGHNTIHLEFRFRGELFHLCVYDTAGIESNKAIIYSVLKDTDCLILAYAVDDKESFDAIIQRYLPDLMKRRDAENIKYVQILGTKCDLRRQNLFDWQPDADPKALEEKYNTKFSINECSSKTGENVSDFFWSMVEELEKHVPTRHNESSTRTSSIPASSTQTWCSLQ